MEAPLGGVAPKPRSTRFSVRSSHSPVPPGALPGDPDRQPFSFVAPRLFFIDRPKRCRGCGVDFVLTARAQKRWCEALGLRLDSRAARCPACRRAFLRAGGLSRALADASRALSQAPLHAPAVLAYARAAVRCAERFGHAPLDAALAALAALRSSGTAVAEAHYWAGRCHETAGRLRRASAAYRRFVKAGVRLRSARSLVADALRRLGASVPRAPARNRLATAGGQTR
jgi:hypothetical protein